MSINPAYSLAILASLIGASAVAQHIDLPLRTGPRPETTNGVPHVQIGIDGVAELSAELSRRVAAFPGVTLGPTRVSLQGAIGYQLDRDMALAHPEAIVGGFEFAHIHPDGSLHASLDPVLARTAVDAGWAIAHPWANQRAGWEGFVMIFTPQSEQELKTVYDLVKSSYTFVTGNQIPRSKLFRRNSPSLTFSYQTRIQRTFR